MLAGFSLFPHVQLGDLDAFLAVWRGRDGLQHRGTYVLMMFTHWQGVLVLLWQDSVARLLVTRRRLIWLLGALLRCFYFDAGQVNHRFNN